MGNFSSKDGHGPTGAHVDMFHTPPTSPVNHVTSVAQLLPPTSPHPHPTSPQTSPAGPAPLPLAASTGKRAQPGATPPLPPEWKLTPPVSSNNSTIGPGLSPVWNNPTPKGQATSGRNGGPQTVTSIPRSPDSQGAVSPAKSPSSPAGSGSPTASSPAGPGWGERDSGLSHEDGDLQGEEAEKLLEECKTTLGVTAPEGGAMTTTEILKHLLTEMKSLRSTLQTERGEWLQFQADLQVAVAVADRLRAEAEEELTALRTVHGDVERELAAAQQRQREADMQLVTLRGELRDSRVSLDALTQGKGQVQIPERPAPTDPNTDPEGSQRGRERGVCRLGQEGMEKECQNEGVTQGARTTSKGVAKRYLRNVTNEDRSGEESRANETQRTVTTERSRSLSRLPVSSDSPTVQNGTSQSNTAITAASTNKNSGQLRGRRSLDWQESKSSTDTGKREESLNKYNSSLTELPSTKSQDGFNLLLRRHGGSKRNSLLRWCQSQTQGYKNIDITNFSSSWADGLAFCAVYHTYLPSHIPYCTLSPESKTENLSLAFKTGENVGIAQSLTVEEMLRTGGPDWQRVLSYVESMYRHFEM